MPTRSLLTRLKNFAFGTSISLSLILAYIYLTDTRASLHTLSPSILRLLYPDAEDSHHAGNRILSFLKTFNLHPRERSTPPELAISVFDSVLDSPLAVSAGLDKNGELPDALFDLGASLVEIGGVTPLPQPGNEGQRVWRIESQNAIINRYGLNSQGADAVARTLRKRVRKFAAAQGLGLGREGEDIVLSGGAGVSPGSLTKGKLLAVQIAKNAATDVGDVEAVKGDYVTCVQKLGRYADVLVVNVSSPNTAGLRSLQEGEALEKILRGVVDASKNVRGKGRGPRVMVKVSPDQDSVTEIAGICEAILSSGVDGVVVGNTTTQRPPIREDTTVQEAEALRNGGGYSGPLTFPQTQRLVGRYRYMLDRMESEGVGTGGKRKKSLKGGAGSKIIFASGGITTGEQALQALEQGAHVAMVYTGLVYGGPGTITRMKLELRDEMIERVENFKREEQAEEERGRKRADELVEPTTS